MSTKMPRSISSAEARSYRAEEQFDYALAEAEESFKKMALAGVGGDREDVAASMDAAFTRSMVYHVQTPHPRGRYPEDALGEIELDFRTTLINYLHLHWDDVTNGEVNTYVWYMGVDGATRVLMTRLQQGRHLHLAWFVTWNQWMNNGFVAAPNPLKWVHDMESMAAEIVDGEDGAYEHYVRMLCDET